MGGWGSRLFGGGEVMVEGRAAELDAWPPNSKFILSKQPPAPVGRLHWSRWLCVASRTQIVKREEALAGVSWDRKLNLTFELERGGAPATGAMP